MSKTQVIGAQGPVKVLWLRMQDMDPRFRGGDGAQQRLVVPAEAGIHSVCGSWQLTLTEPYSPPTTPNILLRVSDDGSCGLPQPSRATDRSMRSPLIRQRFSPELEFEPDYR